MSAASTPDADICWSLLYTKARAEAWAEIDLRRQGFETLLPRVAGRALGARANEDGAVATGAGGGGFRPLFPRYLFVGHSGHVPPRWVSNTFGVLYVVRCGERPARVPDEVIAELRGRMNEHGVVQLERAAPTDPLFARRERERVRALVKFAQAGFRVRVA